jgi:uncharacterized membrane protein
MLVSFFFMPVMVMLVPAMMSMMMIIVFGTTLRRSARPETGRTAVRLVHAEAARAVSCSA